MEEDPGLTPLPPASARRARALLPCTLLPCALLFCACVTFDPDAQPDDDPATPPRSATPLSVTAASPLDGATLPSTYPAIWWSFDQYLDPNLIGFHNTLSLTSGGVSFTVRAHYELVDKRVVGRLTRPLEPGLAYLSTLRYDNIRSLSGAALSSQPTVTFSVPSDADPERPTSDLPIPSWQRDIAPILSRGCTCHAQTLRPEDRPPDLPAGRLDLSPLTYDALVQRPSAQRPDLLLVRPLDPPRSYLMHKLLADYPSRLGAPMPPPWSTSLTPPIPHQPLSLDQLRTIELWIRAGAPP